MANLEPLLKEIEKLDDSDRLDLIAQISLMIKKMRLPPSKQEQDEQISEEERCRILRLLDSVRELIPTDLPPVSNRDHDEYLYGKP